MSSSYLLVIPTEIVLCSVWNYTKTQKRVNLAGIPNIQSLYDSSDKIEDCKTYEQFILHPTTKSLMDENPLIKQFLTEKYTPYEINQREGLDMRRCVTKHVRGGETIVVLLRLQKIYTRYHTWLLSDVFYWKLEYRIIRLLPPIQQDEH